MPAIEALILGTVVILIVMFATRNQQDGHDRTRPHHGNRQR